MVGEVRFSLGSATAQNRTVKMEGSDCRAALPEPVCCRSGFHVEFRHRHSSGGHLGGEHGSRVHHGGGSHLQSQQHRVKQIKT